MVNLKEDSENINQFIISGFERFSNEVQRPTMMGVYCCPWSGWITLNFNITYNLNEAFYSCPDFEFVEYEIIEFKHWEEECESMAGIWSDNKLETYQFNINDGDEGINKFFFFYLKNLIINLNQQYKLPAVLIQMLDSKFCEKVI